jgi:hypothetical protein
MAVVAAVMNVVTDVIRILVVATTNMITTVIIVLVISVGVAAATGISVVSAIVGMIRNRGRICVLLREVLQDLVILLPNLHYLFPNTNTHTKK